MTAAFVVVVVVESTSSRTNEGRRRRSEASAHMVCWLVMVAQLPCARSLGWEKDEDEEGENVRQTDDACRG